MPKTYIAFEESEYSSTISIELSTYPGEAKTVSELMKKADLAMYTAKKVHSSLVPFFQKI